MKKLLLAMLLCLLALVACKKEQPQATNLTAKTDTTANLPVTPSPITPSQVTISGVSPASGVAGTIVTITGTNFGTSITGVTVSFNGKAGTVQSVTPTEIKVVVPVTTTATIVVVVLGQYVVGPQFTYLLPYFTAPYVSGDVTLNSQTAVDLFAAANKGKQLQITGNLSISGTDITSVAGLSNVTSVTGEISIWSRNLTEASFLNTITSAGSIKILFSGFNSLSFNSLNSFSGKIYFQSLQNLNHISFNGLTTNNGGILIDSCPLLTDLSFLNNLKSSAGFSLSAVGATSITMDKLTTTGGMYIASCNSLNTVSMKALTEVTTDGTLTFSACSSLSNLNFSALTAIPGKLTISGTSITDMTGFNSLVKVGSLTVMVNSLLVNFRGLEHLTTFTKPAIGSSSANLITILNGIYIFNNPKLTSLTGLQNITTLPLAYITGNTGLDNFCPFKASINALSTLPAYSYQYYNNNSNRYSNNTVAALTLTSNSNYATTADALAAVKLCN